MYRPLREARHTSREFGEMERLPTGWLTVMVAPSQNGSSLSSDPLNRVPAAAVRLVVPRSSLGRNRVRGLTDMSGGMLDGGPRAPLLLLPLTPPTPPALVLEPRLLDGPLGGKGTCDGDGESTARRR